MSYSNMFVPVWRPMVLVAVTLGLMVPAPEAWAQFGQADAVNDWMSKALPGAFGNLPTYSTSNPSGGSSSNVFSANNNISVQGYQLGIYKQDLDVGTLVQDIQPSSAAARAGLQKQDLIVTVNGQQVGNTPRGLMDIGVVTNQMAVAGKVVLLVADARTGKLKNVQVDLVQTARTLEGKIQLPDSRALASSYMTISLKNLNRPMYDVTGGKTSGPIGGYGPWSFSLQIDPQSVYRGDRYQLQIEVVDSRNSVLYGAIQDVDIGRLLDGNPNFQNVVLQSSNNGQVVQAAYNQTTLEETFRSVMGLYPTPSETYGWAQFLKENNYNYDEMKIKLLSHAIYYERLGNDPQRFIDSMIRILAKRNPTPQEVSQWTARLQQAYGQREAVVREFMAVNGSGSQLR